VSPPSCDNYFCSVFFVRIVGLCKFVWYFRNAKAGDLPEHKFEIDIELEGKAEEVCLDSGY